MQPFDPKAGPVFARSDGPLSILFYIDDKKAFNKLYPLTRVLKVLRDSKAEVQVEDRGTPITEALLSKFHEVWFFLAATAHDTKLTDTECTALRAWMDRGGGVLLTGDHANENDAGGFEGLGRSIGARVPRARHMRVWDAKPGLTRRLGSVNTTEISPGRRMDSLDLEQDSTPQRLLLPTDVAADPHVIFRDTCDGILDRLPDHPHEGKVVAPELPLPDEPLAIPAHVNEWWDERVAPQIVARGIDWYRGDCFETMAVWDGHAVRSVKKPDKSWHVCGRIIADSSWHHYVDPNLDKIAGADTEDWAKIQAFYINQAAWLAPPELKRAYREQACKWVGEHRDYVLVGEDRRLGVAAYKLLAHKLPGAWFHELASDLLREYADADAIPVEFRDVLMGAYMRLYMSDGKQRPRLHRVDQPDAPGLITEVLASLDDELLLKQERLDSFRTVVGARR